MKSVSTEKAANSAVRHGLKQIQENPGGIILNYAENRFSETKLKDILRRRIEASATQTVDIIVLQQGKCMFVLRHKK